MGIIRKYLALAGLLAVIVTSSGCGASGTATDITNRTLAVIQNAINQLDANSANWRETLNQALDKLPKDAQSTIRTELTDLTTRTVAAVGEQFKCAVDFLGQRAKEGLQRIKASLLHQAIALRPALCDVTPSTVDMSLSPERRTHIDISGYNFDAAPGMSLYLRRTGEEVLLDRNFLSIQTHYHMTINLGSNGVPLTSTSQALIIRWNGSDFSTIQLVQPLPPACKTTPYSASVSPRTYVPPWTAGDKEFFGHADIHVKVSLIKNDTFIDGEIYMKAEQPNDDHTTAEGTDHFRVYTAPAGWKISQLDGPTEDPELHYLDTTWEDDHFGGGGGIVSEYTVRGDHNGADAGTWTQVTISFNALKVTLVENQGCV
jgi:hypothetical protein